MKNIGLAAFAGFTEWLAVMVVWKVMLTWPCQIHLFFQNQKSGLTQKHFPSLGMSVAGLGTTIAFVIPEISYFVYE